MTASTNNSNPDRGQITVKDATEANIDLVKRLNQVNYDYELKIRY